ncbi:hypothetical protein N7519_008951 [Penicillium mononematosum]|uniref:uncharacterized protein n=1 Tax=Penicillium mononematosum TaxID=268346 RepID=UPI002549AA83|nr:uncharacterized protein N7519_008951 [Penicillium mononematosum]KAJ6178490.1 hypothetical protein N7519_008951 [Penicillium mononematosum]
MPTTTTTPARQVMVAPTPIGGSFGLLGLILVLGFLFWVKVPCASDAPEPPTNGDAGETPAADMLDEEDKLEDENRDAA